MMLDRLVRLSDGLIALSAMIGTAGLIVVTGVIVADVAGRNLGVPLFGAQDLVTMTMVLIVFGGMALCDRTGGHIAVDIFQPWFPDGVNRAIDILAAALGAVIFLAIAYAVFRSAQLSQMLNLSTNLLRLPTAWFQFALVGLSLVSALALSLRAAVTLIRGAAPAPWPEAEP